MNKGEFIEVLSKKLEKSKIETTKVFNTILKCITESLKTNDELKFVGFGAFKVKRVKEKTVTTPAGQKIQVPAKKRVSFVVGEGLKEVVNSK